MIIMIKKRSHIRKKYNQGTWIKTFTMLRDKNLMLKIIHQINLSKQKEINTKIMEIMEIKIKSKDHR